MSKKSIAPAATKPQPVMPQPVMPQAVQNDRAVIDQVLAQACVPRAAHGAAMEALNRLSEAAGRYVLSLQKPGG